MKSNNKIFSFIIAVLIAFQVNAQLVNANQLVFSETNKIENDSFNLKQVVKVIDEIGLIIMPQFDGLFSKILNENVEGINIKNYFMDFDFGFNFGLNYKLAKTLNVDVIYNIGMIKFNMINSGSIPAPYVKICLNYFMF